MIDSLLYKTKQYIPEKVFLFFRPVYHLLLAWSAALFYGFPSRRLKVIGVTGTKGKSTTVELLHEILASSGARVASLSSVRFRVHDAEVLNERKMTMPGRFFVQRFLHDARRARCQYVILEVTSEGIAQFRHRFINFSGAVMTNIAPEHIESHGSFEKYLRAKLDLFWRLPAHGFAIINSDDVYASRFAAATCAKKNMYSRTGIHVLNKTYALRDGAADNDGIRFELGGVDMQTALVGDYNIMNICAAAAAGLACNISLEAIARAIQKIKKIPGRMEFIQRAPYVVVVDYAHTPDSLKSVYSFLKKSDAPLICVLGAAGGGRDAWKRPEFGALAAEYCDTIILTNEDPYDEDPEEIIKQVETGIMRTTPRKTGHVEKILDRREAIRAALRSAGAGDTVVITGKGSEPWIMGPRHTKIPWSDRRTAEEELQKNESRSRILT